MCSIYIYIYTSVCVCMYVIRLERGRQAKQLIIRPKQLQPSARITSSTTHIHKLNITQTTANTAIQKYTHQSQHIGNKTS